MTTIFFQNIASLNLEGVWKLAISTDKSGNITVSQLFNTTCGDKAASLIIPLTLSGTAQELDEAFFDEVSEPAIKSARLQVNMEAHLKSVEAAQAASKLEGEKKMKGKIAAAAKKCGTGNDDDEVELPEPKVSREDKKKAYTEVMLQVDELAKRYKFSDALAILPPISDYPARENELKKKAGYLQTQSRFYEKVAQDFND